MNRFHCCATCKHFEAVKKEKGVRYLCSRLGYETNPKYQFACWDPKNHIKEKMAEEQKELHFRK